MLKLKDMKSNPYKLYLFLRKEYLNLKEDIANLDRGFVKDPKSVFCKSKNGDIGGRWSDYHTGIIKLIEKIQKRYFYNEKFDSSDVECMINFIVNHGLIESMSSHSYFDEIFYSFIVFNETKINIEEE